MFERFVIGEDGDFFYERNGSEPFYTLYVSIHFHRLGYCIYDNDEYYDGYGPSYGIITIDLVDYV